MLKLGILGGTFNPIHIGHLIMAEYALEGLNLDKIIFMPTGRPPHKDINSVVDASHRIAMIKESIKSNKSFEISEIETQRSGTTYTYYTLKELKEIYKEAKLYFIVGYDTLLDMKNWHKVEEVVKLANFIIINRDEDENIINKKCIEFSKIYGANIYQINMPNIEISSSLVRDRVMKNKSIAYIVPDIVEKYINDNNLYRGE